ncbi:MAG: hypothetical protein ACOX3G_05270 [Armatimonadota bacterium]|jgi:hypothetical protein
MENLKNIMPVAVHLASGGSARVRIGGQSVPLEDISDGSFDVEGGTGFRLFFVNASGLIGTMLIGYETPLDLSNASLVTSDMEMLSDDVPAGTTVYFALVDADGDPVQGGEGDVLHVSIYG